jgi:hypothetical protein
MKFFFFVTHFFSKFEALAYDLLQYCYENDKEKAKAIISTNCTEFENKTCFEIVQNDFEITRHDENHASEYSSSEIEETKKIVAHPCFQDVVASKWHGESIHFSRKEYVFYLVICFIFFPILFFPFLGFHVNIFL